MQVAAPAGMILNKSRLLNILHPFRLNGHYHRQKLDAERFQGVRTNRDSRFGFSPKSIRRKRYTRLAHLWRKTAVNALKSRFRWMGGLQACAFVRCGERRLLLGYSPTVRAGRVFPALVRGRGWGRGSGDPRYSRPGGRRYIPVWGTQVRGAAGGAKSRSFDCAAR